MKLLAGNKFGANKIGWELQSTCDYKNSTLSWKTQSKYYY